MRVSFSSFVAVVFLLSFGALAHAQVNTFTTNLWFGSRGTEVSALQQELNRDPDTRVAATGPGSPGNETSYFGPLTKSAVIRFQEKYANEILTPVDLTQGSGYVGPYTRAKLNALSVSVANAGSAVGISQGDTPSATVATTNITNTFTTNMSLGYRGAQVIALQQLLNRDPYTRVAATGPGSPGNETSYFGPLLEAAVIRFQERHASEVLTPAGLTQGSGSVDSYTMAELNTLSASMATAGSAVGISQGNGLVIENPTNSSTAGTLQENGIISTPSLTDYLVKDSEKIDIYVEDKVLANIKNKINTTINATIDSYIASYSAFGTIPTTTPITIPSITMPDIPSASIGTPSPRSGVPGTYVSLNGIGISTNSVVYFGSNYIVRKVSKDISGNFTFIVPPIPPGRYDIAVRTGGVVSNTKMFVITDPKNPPVHLESVSPATVSYGGTLTITGSGFTPQNNVVVTIYQTFTNVPSVDGTTLTVQVAPDGLQMSAKVGNGKSVKPMSVYVVNDYGFSDSVKSFTMTL